MNKGPLAVCMQKQDPRGSINKIHAKWSRGGSRGGDSTAQRWRQQIVTAHQAHWRQLERGEGGTFRGTPTDHAQRVSVGLNTRVNTRAWTPALAARSRQVTLPRASALRPLERVHLWAPTPVGPNTNRLSPLRAELTWIATLHALRTPSPPHHHLLPLCFFYFVYLWAPLLPSWPFILKYNWRWLTGCLVSV